MNNRYLYQTNDKVVHCSEPNMLGTITEQVSCDEGGEPSDVLNPNDPWYHIRWEDGSIGFEQEYNLLPSTTNMIPTKVVQYLYEHDNNLWKELVSRVN